jgi:hypothetical protein
MAAQIGQGGQTKRARPLCGALLCESHARLIEQRIPNKPSRLAAFGFF